MHTEPWNRSYTLSTHTLSKTKLQEHRYIDQLDGWMVFRRAYTSSNYKEIDVVHVEDHNPRWFASDSRWKASIKASSTTLIELRSSLVGTRRFEIKTLDMLYSIWWFVFVYSSRILSSLNSTCLTSRPFFLYWWWKLKFYWSSRGTLDSWLDQ